MKVNAVRHTLTTARWKLMLLRINLQLPVIVTVVEVPYMNRRIALIKAHNWIMFLEKPLESNGFEQIVDFLNANQIKYALTPQRKHKPRRKQRMETVVSPTEKNTKEHVPTPSNDPLPSGENRMQLKELMKLCTNLSNKVLNLENEVIEMKSSHKEKIKELDSRVEKLEEKNRRKIIDIDPDAEANLENVYNLDMAYEKIVLSMQYVDVQSERIDDVVKDVEDVVATAKNVEGIKAATIPKISKDAVTLAQTLIEIKAAKPKAKWITMQKPKPKMHLTRKDEIALDEELARGLEVKWNADIKDNIDWNKVVKQVQSRQSDVVRKYQALKRKPVSVAQARKNMMIYLKNMAGYKMDYFKGITYKQIRPIFKMEYNKVQAYLNKGPEMDAERIKAPRDRTRKEKVDKDQPAKKQKGDELEQDNAKKQKLEEQEEAEELKKNLKIVFDDEDDVFVNVTPLSSKPPTIANYKIYKERKKEHFK
nr:hypothetical protein [Tanacetum cinerariifolium]